MSEEMKESEGVGLSEPTKELGTREGGERSSVLKRRRSRVRRGRERRQEESAVVASTHVEENITHLEMSEEPRGEEVSEEEAHSVNTEIPLPGETEKRPHARKRRRRSKSKEGVQSESVVHTQEPDVEAEIHQDLFEDGEEEEEEETDLSSGPAQRMLIDAHHPEEIRVALVRGFRLEEYEVESASRSLQKGNVYLGKIVRVEPSLQAAFVEYGEGRHGFLSFQEIHPDYFKIPVEDKIVVEGSSASSEEETEEEAEERTRFLYKKYKIQEVIKNRQIVLIQVVKEPRGTKGASLTTFVSLAGRYCVLMPNALRGGGISRKITDVSVRRRLKTLLEELDLPPNTGVIVRTAGMERTKAEIKRDLDYLLKLWEDIRELTLSSSAPSLIYREGDLIKRALRDGYSKDIVEVLVEGEEGYKEAKEFMKLLMPSHAKRIKIYREGEGLFRKFYVEEQIEDMHTPIVQLRSGGYIVINPTEALIAIDVNSGKANKDRHIEETALRTNLEAAEEAARQIRLRDLAGLIVIDFIDMNDHRHNAAVERRLRDCLRYDRSRSQLGRISPFGLLELSRQRLRPNILEASSVPCPRCGGTGMLRSTDSVALKLLRTLEQGMQELSLQGEPLRRLILTVALAEGLYLLNQKRQALLELETRYGCTLEIQLDPSLLTSNGVLHVEREEGEREEIPLDHFTRHALRPEGGTHSPEDLALLEAAGGDRKEERGGEKRPSRRESFVHKKDQGRRKEPEGERETPKVEAHRWLDESVATVPAVKDPFRVMDVTDPGQGAVTFESEGSSAARNRGPKRFSRNEDDVPPKGEITKKEGSVKRGNEAKKGSPSEKSEDAAPSPHPIVINPEFPERQPKRGWWQALFD